MTHHTWIASSRRIITSSLPFHRIITHHIMSDRIDKSHHITSRYTMTHHASRHIPSSWFTMSHHGTSHHISTHDHFAWSWHVKGKRRHILTSSRNRILSISGIPACRYYPPPNFYLHMAKNRVPTAHVRGVSVDGVDSVQSPSHDHVIITPLRFCITIITIIIITQLILHIIVTSSQLASHDTIRTASAPSHHHHVTTSIIITRLFSHVHALTSSTRSHTCVITPWHHRTISTHGFRSLSHWSHHPHIVTQQSHHRIFIN